MVDPLDANTEIYPGWNKRDFFAHIAGWEAVVFDRFYYYVNGIAPKYYPQRPVDEMNVGFVAERQSATVEGAKLECEINRFAIKTLLSQIPAERYDEAVLFPWGSETISQWLQGAINHERKHALEIMQMRG